MALLKIFDAVQGAVRSNGLAHLDSATHLPALLR
jgi:hypothetical protein